MAFWNKKEKPKQDLCVVGTNTAEDMILDASILHAENYTTTEAWALDTNNQYIDEKTGRYVQLVTHRDINPVTVNKTLPVVKINKNIL